MIVTLKNLHEATAQQVFTQVATHLLTQKRRSQNTGGGCFYRFEALKCAAGCLIGDDEYLPEMDMKTHDEGGTSWDSLISRGLVPTALHSPLIARLQSIHDTVPVNEWVYHLQDLANYNKFSMPILEVKA